MREVQVTNVEARLPEILDDVERGETFVITRQGRPIARIVPEVPGRDDDVSQAVADIMAIRLRTGRITVEDLISARDEDRRG